MSGKLSGAGAGADDPRSPLLRPPTEEAERMGIDDMLRRYAGEFGPWQLRHFVLASLPWALEAFHTMVMIFADMEPDPSSSSTAGDACAVAASGASTVTEWGLVCGEKYKVGLVQSAFFAGSMIGAGVFGHLSDSFLGRKGSLTVVCLMNAIFGLLTAVSPAYWVYVIFRFFTGFSTGGVGLCAFILATEIMGPNKRGIAGMSTFYFFSGGIAILSGIAYAFPTWRALYVVSSLPSLLFLLLVLPFVSESPRWYLVRRRNADAMKVMNSIARSNKKEIPSNATLILDDDDGSDVAESGTIIDVLRSPTTRTRLVLSVGVCFLCSIVYYGLSLNVVNLRTNLYISVLLNAVAEMPAFLLTALLIDRFGRRAMGAATMWTSGVFCVAGSLFLARGAARIARVACGVLGIFGMAATYNLLFIYTAELFPTVVRNAALGCATQAGQLGAILAPMVVVLGERIPFAVFGACGVVGGLLFLYLPETMHKPLYDTMAGMEEGEGEGKPLS